MTPTPCGKTCHDTNADARRAMFRRKASQRVHNADRLHVYYCADCQAWHYGHAPNNPKAPRNGREGRKS